LYEEREKNRDKSVGQLTGFHLLDEATRGFLPGSYVLFYAQTACGKSFILTNIMAHLWRQRKNIVYFTLSDLSAEQIKYRLTACITSIETNKIRFATLNDAEKKRLREFNKAAQEWDGNILILNPAYCTISDIQAKLDTLSWKPDAIFVDYLNVLNSNAIESSNYDYKVQVAYSQALKSLAVSRQTVVYTVAQAVDGANEIATKNVFFDRENLIAFSKAILQPVDYSAFVRYSNDDRALSRIVFFSSKVRDMSRIDWNSRIDFSRAKIDSGSLYDPISTGGKK
jgi:replicative DNA helicase